MWQVENRTPFAVERGWVRDRSGAEVWLVAAKCTFDIARDGSTSISAEQPPALRAPEHHGEPGKSSIKYDADLVAAKTTTDVIVIGHACAPGGQAVTHLDLRLRLGSVDKTLRVIGDRIWRRGGAAAPNPFVRMPLVYERAFGGADIKSADPDRHFDVRNPVGTAFATAHANLIDRPLPNIEYPDDRFDSWQDRPRPAGFGAIAAHWQPRAALAGTYDDRWKEQRQPLLPVDFDDRFFQCAPADQQTATFLRGGEPVFLRGFVPHGDLTFVLPKVFLGYETWFSGGGREFHQQRRLHAVILEPDCPRVSLVWHTALACHHHVQKLERTIVSLKTEAAGKIPASPSPALELA